MEKRSLLSFDKTLLLVVIALLAIGVYVIYTGSEFSALNRDKPPYFYALKHLRMLCVGIGAMIFGFFIDHRIYHKFAHPAFLVCLVALVGVIFLGVAIKGASRWLSIGGFSVQPAELMKIAMFAYMSKRLSELGDEITDLKKGFFQPLVTIAIVLFLILRQPNFSMTLLVGATMMALLFVAGVRGRYLLSLLLATIPIGVFVGLSAAYRMKRIQSWLHPEEYLQSDGYQLYNALVSLGHGGILGTGIGQGTQKLGFLPEAYKDVAFSLIGEEFGFVGTTIVLALFGVLVWRGFRIARNAKTRFAKYFAICLTTSIALNVIFHVFVCTGLMPTTGQPMPFISYGGTNLVMSLLSIGILLNISRAGTGSRIVESWSSAQDVRFS